LAQPSGDAGFFSVFQVSREVLTLAACVYHVIRRGGASDSPSRTGCRYSETAWELCVTAFTWARICCVDGDMTSFAEVTCFVESRMSEGVLPHVAHGNLNRSRDIWGDNDADVGIITVADSWLTRLLDIWIGACVLLHWKNTSGIFPEHLAWIQGVVCLHLTARTLRLGCSSHMGQQVAVLMRRSDCEIASIGKPLCPMHWMLRSDARSRWINIRGSREEFLSIDHFY
jgi:hypothetical protein